jgi:uncharacterized protein YkwD
MKNLFFTTLFTIIAVISSAQVDNTKLQQDFVKELNAYRASKGLSSLTLNTQLTNISKAQSQYCASINKLTHERPNNDVYFVIENAYSTSQSPIASDCLNAWKNSSKHNEILLLKDLSEIGIYAVKSNTGQYYIILNCNTKINY